MWELKEVRCCICYCNAYVENSRIESIQVTHCFCCSGDGWLFELQLAALTFLIITKVNTMKHKWWCSNETYVQCNGIDRVLCLVEDRNRTWGVVVPFVVLSARKIHSPKMGEDESYLSFISHNMSAMYDLQWMVVSCDTICLWHEVSRLFIKVIVLKR